MVLSKEWLTKWQSWAAYKNSTATVADFLAAMGGGDSFNQTSPPCMHGLSRTLHYSECVSQIRVLGLSLSQLG